MKRFERLTLADLSNLALEGADTQMNQGALGVLDGSALLDADGHVRIEVVRAHLASRLDRVPLLRRRLWRTAPFQGRPMWVDDASFRIEDHVLVAPLREPGGDAGATEFAQQRMSTVMDRRRPLWELWLLEGYGDGRVGIFLKLHHVLADGGAILNIAGLLFDPEPGVIDSVGSTWKPSPPPRGHELVLDNLAGKAEGVRRAARALAHPLVGARRAAASWGGVRAALREGLHAPNTSLNRRIGSDRVVGVLRLGLAEVKSVARAYGVKVNDVILDLLASGVRSVFTSRGETTHDVAIHASMAVRLPDTDRAAVGGNHTGTMLVPLRLDEDESTRLTQISQATARAKEEQRGAVPQALMIVLAITGLMRFFVRRQHMVNVLATNLAGPPFPLYVAGAELRDVFAITPISGNVTFSVAALSYNGRIDLSVDADAASWPDLDVLVSGMAEGWRRLEATGPLGQAGRLTAA